MKTLKRSLVLLLKIALTAAFLYLAFSKFDLKDSKLARPADWDMRWIAAGLLFGLGSVLLSAARWWLLLKAQEIPVSFWRAVSLTFIGNLFNLVAPGGVGGDAAKIFLLIREYPDRKLPITLTVMVDHLVGLIGLALIFFCVTAGRFDALAEQSRLGKEVIRFAWMFFSGGLVMIALMFITAYPPIHRRIHRPGREFRWEIMRRLPEVYDVFRKRWGLALASLVAALVMLQAFFASFWCGARALGSQVDWWSVCSAMPVADAAGAVPLAIAGLGIRETVFETLMHDLAGMPADIAVPASLIGFFCSLAWSLVLGIILFLKPRDRVRIKDMESAAASS